MKMATPSIFSLLNPLRFNALHYNSITHAWIHIFGDNFHFGYFSSPNTSLDEATDALIDKMAVFGELSEKAKVLDVGCGIGAPAFYLHRKFGCDVTGISTSDIGVHNAEEESKKRGYRDSVRFRVANGLDNGFADNTFDVVWVMESSHLMKDKRKLLAECHRVLKPGGVMLLCDIMWRRPYTIADRFGYLLRLKSDFIVGAFDHIRSFGLVHMETFDTYINTARQIGFDDVKLIDISEQAVPTFERWKANIAANEARILQTLTARQMKGFMQAADFSKDIFERKIGGYGILKALKR
ncbi:MAG: methyltransferase domain-containing protein [Deltaproteobacteria bacterium]|nr:methyltransferase domain-containing protein [Deltaproteobacteria bacterium]